jgi:outer membrane protein TolC
MTQPQSSSAFARLLALLVGLSLLNGCGAKETPRSATNFVYRNARVVVEPPPAPPPSKSDTKAEAPAPPARPERPEAPARLTLLEAIGQALRRNQKIQVSAYNPRKAVQDLKGAESVYDSAIFSSGNKARVKRPTQSLLDTGSTAETKLIEDRYFVRTGAKKFLPSGATVSVYQELDHLTSNSLFTVPDPQATSRAIIEVSQPILRGWWDKTNRAAISIAKLNIDISNEEFRQVVMDVVADVAKAYWQLALEREFELIAARTLGMAEEVRRRETVRMEKGISTQLDADRALAAAETRQADLLRAQTRVKIVSDQLKLLLNFSEALPEVIPVDKPLMKPIPVDIEEATAEAIKNRPELERAQKTISVTKERKDLAQHNKLPKLDAVVRFSRAGLGVSPGRAIDTVYGSENNNWLAGVEFEYPWGNRASKAEYDKRSLEYDQASKDARRVKDQVISEVSLATREIHLAQKEIPTTLQAKTAAERVVVSENARFELGQKTNEELLRAQDLLAAAEREYVRAVINYNISLANLGRARGTILKNLGIVIEE